LGEVVTEALGSILPYGSVYLCSLCLEQYSGAHTCPVKVSYDPSVKPFKFEEREMKKIKLSADEKAKFNDIRNYIYNEYILGVKVDHKFAYDLGWLIGLIDRITE
jgi:hypothetical protein